MRVESELLAKLVTFFLEVGLLFARHMTDGQRHHEIALTVIELVKPLQRPLQLVPIRALHSEFLQLDPVLDRPQQALDAGQSRPGI
ncbi:hypothetical protein [Rhodococcus sp. 14-2470-1b]|uniref:hypothetical protein n=1 Tax=Rhodococcus sp. 14-2470-1b TaxID=2023149 RepID=UPI00113FC6AF|nr:hypothetical protein [Rhodococcus sp. 14-2470-1b]